MPFFEYYYPTLLSYSQFLFLIQKEVSALIHLVVPLPYRLQEKGRQSIKRLKRAAERILDFPYDAQLVKEILESLGYGVSLVYKGFNAQHEDLYIIYKSLPHN